jgi:uncharacterized repeat protein (TIGR01451 family)
VTGVCAAAPAGAAMQVKTGSYVGDGQNDRAVTGLGFQPDVVIVKNGSTGSTMVRTATMAGDISKALGTASGLESGHIKSLDADGFTVGTRSEVNQNGATIYWVAFEADPAEMVLGSYIGDGTDDRSISGAGFTPGYVLVMNEGGQQAYQRFADQTGDASRQFGASSENSNRIQGFESDGFQVGSNLSVNESGLTIHYVAWNLTPGSISAGVYAGDGNDDRNITGIGQHPVYMILADRQGNFAAIHRPASLGGNASLSTAGGGAFSNAIQAFLSDGFQVGSHLATNALSTTYYWVAFGQGQSVDLDLAKTVNDPMPLEGDTVSFTVVLSNQGAVSATGAGVTDLLPPGLTYVSHTATQGAYDDVTGLWSAGTLAPGAADTLIITASADPGTGGALVTNTARITALDQSDTNSANDQASAGVQVQTDLSLTVTGDPQAFATLLPGAAPVEVFRVRVNNGSTQPGTVSGLVLTNAASGPGSPGQLDAEWSSFSLYLDTGGTPLFLGSAAMTLGQASYSGLSVPVPAGGTAVFFVLGAPSLAARDTDRLDLVLTGPAAVSFAEAAVVNGVWPVDPAGYFVVDGMSAAQVTVNPMAGRTVTQGASRELALDVVVPPNGYEADVLNRFNVVNLGSAVSPSDVEIMELWRDAGTPGFDPAQDVRLGVMENTGVRWEVTGLQVPIPVAGLRLFVSLDVNDGAARTSSIRLAVPSGPDLGIGVASGNSGPLDQAAANDQIITVTNQDRVAFSAPSIAPGTALPGAAGVLLLHLTAANSYTVAKTLTGLRVTSAGTGPGSAADRDGGVRLLTLYGDGDGDGMFDGASEPVLGTGSFTGGIAAFQNFQVAIAPGAITHFFLAARVSLTGARDGDVLSARLQGPIDVDFSDPTAAAAVWPVSSGAAWTVDGMAAAQIATPGGGTLVLGPGDGPVDAFTFDLPGNGYEIDVLTSVRLENRGDADAADISDVRLWSDGGNGAFDNGAGDDSDLGGLTWTGSGWQSLGLSTSVPAQGRRFFTSLSVAPGFSDSALVDLVIPVGGVVMQSGNDGPLDAEVADPLTIQLSDAPLLGRIDFSSLASTLGQTVTVRMIVTNRGTEDVAGIVPAALTANGSGVFTPVGGPQPASTSLAPAATDTFVWTYRSDGVGPVTLSGSASGTGSVSGEPRSTRSATSPLHTIYSQAPELRVSATDLMPTTITLGQSAVVPLSLTVSNPGGAESSDIRLDRLRIRLEDETGAGIVPVDLLNRVVVNEGLSVFLDKTSLETTGAGIDLPLGAPFPNVLVPGNSPVTLSLQLHLASTTSVTRFRVVITGASWVQAVDAVSGASVPVVLENGTFPIRTGLANLVGAASLMTVAGAPPVTLQAGPGQPDVPLLSFTLENPGTGNTSAARVGEFAIVVADGTGMPLPDAAAALKRLQVQALGQTVYSEGLVSESGDSLVLALSPPIVVLENTQVQVTVTGSVADTAAAGLVRAALGPESAFDVRDGNTGDPILVTYPQGPVDGNTVEIQAPAREMAAASSALLPATVTLGENDIDAMSAVLMHPGSAGDAPIRVNGLTINVRDEKGQALVPAACLDRVRILWNGSEAVSAAPLPTGPQPVTAALSAILIPAGASAAVTIVIDIDAGAPPTQLQLSINGAGIDAVDANLGEPVTVVPLPGYDLPLISGLTRLVLPARDLLASLESLMPAALAADGSTVAAGALTLSNPAPDGSSPVRVAYLRVRGADRDFSPVNVGAAVTRMSLYMDGELFAASDTLGTDSTTAWIPFPDDLVLSPEKQRTLELRVSLRPGSQVTSLRLGYEAGDVGVVQPTGSLLPLNVRGTGGQAFPLWTEAGTLSAASLAGSYSNFPNPFHPRREETVFVYFLSADARVTLRLWSTRGEKVITLLDAERRSAGLYQSDRWDGLNGEGHSVVSGVYIAELEVQYADGSAARLVRKVAVVR